MPGIERNTFPRDCEYPNSIAVRVTEIKIVTTIIVSANFAKTLLKKKKKKGDVRAVNSAGGIEVVALRRKNTTHQVLLFLSKVLYIQTW